MDESEIMMALYSLHIIYLWIASFFADIQKERRETEALIKIVALLKEEEKQMVNVVSSLEELRLNSLIRGAL
jgi:hypothetical protein